ncbi:MAG: pyridoxal phosphate-dependent aminotransferase [Paracoccaceae bacterium]|jgi:arginine:pyruvate transaminase|nr:pyridoxal phosphate-dependent aminotransferase [Paracoccaceae bacterium]
MSPSASDRIKNITINGSDGWEVFNKARRMISNGEKVIELSIGEHDIRTSTNIIDSMHKSALNGNTGYAEMQGLKKLRELIAKRNQERTGDKTNPENIIITPGGQAGLFATHMATCNEGDRALFLDPYYATYPGTIRSVGARAIPIKTQSKNGFQPTFDEIDSQATDAKTLLINSPNNPTGVVYSKDTFNSIAKAVIKHKLWLISDEVYDCQIWNGTHLTPRSIDAIANQTLVIGSMSKSYAMTGFRCGWVIGPESIVENMVNLATSTTYGVPAFIQDAAFFALNKGSEIEKKVSEPFLRRYESAQSILNDAKNIKLIPGDGTMYLMLDIRDTGLSGEEFANLLLNEKKIAVMPGESFGTAAAGHLRIAMTVADDIFQHSLVEIKEFAKNF